MTQSKNDNLNPSGSTKRKATPILSKKIVALAAAAIVVLGGIYLGSTQSQAGAYKFAVGTPGPGEIAPEIRLDARDTGNFDLSAQRGKNVLLYFQEGLMCQPCWDQLKDIEANIDDFRAAGVDQIISVTTDPAELLEKKRAAEGLKTPVYSDRSLAASQAYSTNLYGMMGESYNGHSFILVGADGRIKWRADYGGAPDYTMYVPVKRLLTDLRAGLGTTE